MNKIVETTVPTDESEEKTSPEDKAPVNRRRSSIFDFEDTKVKLISNNLDNNVVLDDADVEAFFIEPAATDIIIQNSEPVEEPKTDESEQQAEPVEVTEVVEEPNTPEELESALQTDTPFQSDSAASGDAGPSGSEEPVESRPPTAEAPMVKLSLLGQSVSNQNLQVKFCNPLNLPRDSSF